MRQEVQEAEERGAQREREEGGYGVVASVVDAATPAPPTGDTPPVLLAEPTVADYVEPTALPSLLALRGGRSFAVPLARAIVTLATSRAYLVGTYALGTSLRRVASDVPRVLALSPELADDPAVLRNATIAGWDYVRPVVPVANPAIDLGRLRQAHKEDIFTKLALYGLTDVRQMLYLDADTVVVRSLDHLLDEAADDPPTVIRAVPELMARKQCADRPEHLFVEDNRTFCHSHTKQPYHGRNLTLYNAGLVLVHPSTATTSFLLELLAAEAREEDTCIGEPGCNDQRLLNLGFSTDGRSIIPLRLVYNVYCDKMLTEDYGDMPYVVHYRGGGGDKWAGQIEGGGGMKPWIVAPADQAPLRWDAADMCLHFTRAHLAFEQRYVEEQPYELEVAAMSADEAREALVRARREADQRYLAEREAVQARAGASVPPPMPANALAMLDLLRAPDEALRARAAAALDAMGFQAATWLHSLGLARYTLLFHRANISPASLALSLSLSNLKSLGVDTDSRRVLREASVDALHEVCGERTRQVETELATVRENVATMLEKLAQLQEAATKAEEAQQVVVDDLPLLQRIRGAHAAAAGEEQSAVATTTSATSAPATASLTLSAVQQLEEELRMLVDEQGDR